MAEQVAPTDAISEGMAQLAEHDKAQRWEFPIAGDPPALGSIIGPIGAPSRRSGQPEDQGTKTLEDLYTRYPAMGGGDWKIRVERTSPASFNGIKVSGFLGEYFDRIPTSGFRERFGGGNYTITMLKPLETGSGETSYRSVGSITVKMPGQPSFEGIPEESSVMMRQFGQQMFPQAGEAAQVAVERLKIEREREQRARDEQHMLQERLDKQMQNTMQAPTIAIDHMREAQKDAIHQIRSTSESERGFWQNEADRLRGEITLRNNEIVSLREQLIKAKQEAVEATQRTETALVREMKERHDQELRRIMDQHSSTVTQMAERHRQESELIGQRHAEERRNYESMQAMERERMRDEVVKAREEARHRVEEIERSRQTEIDRIREDAKQRVDDINRSMEKELLRVQEITSREVKSTKESERLTATFSEKSAELRIELMRADLERLRNESDEQRRQAEALRDKLYKSPVEAIQEAKTLAAIGGMVEPDELGDDKSEKDETTTDKLIGIAKTVAPQIPQIMEKISQNRSEAMMGQLQRQQQIIQQQAEALRRIQSQARALPPAQRPRTSPVVAGRPVPGFIRPQPQPHLQPTMAVPLGSNRPRRGGSAVPLGAGAMMDASQSSVPTPIVADQTQQAVEVHGQTPGAQQPTGDMSDLETFVGQLDQIIRSGQVAPSDFASSLLQQIGPEKAEELLKAFKPDDLIELVRASGQEDNSILSRDGTKYVSELWASAEKMLPAQQ